MDLALEFGMPAELLARTMTEREFQRWHRYAQNKALPTRRLEYYLAQVSKWIAQTMGGAKDVSLSDFLIVFESDEPEDADGEVDVAELHAAFDFRPRSNISAEQNG